MSHPSEPAIPTNLDLGELNSEVKSYIYQMILEFEPFTTPDTVVAVVAKDPMKLYSKLRDEGISPLKSELKKMHRIGITLTENGAKIEEEGLESDIYAAIRQAKDKLIRRLSEIQDEVVTNQERKAQINSAINGSSVH